MMSMELDLKVNEGGTFVRQIDESPAIQDRLEYLPLLNDRLELAASELFILKVLNSGHYGEVHLGLLNTPNGSKLPVAVKKPKSQSNEDDKKIQRDSLRDELKIMTNIDTHPNVLQLLGAITQSKDDFCLVTEYCEFGSLDSVLKEKFAEGKIIDELIMEGVQHQGQESESITYKRQIDENWDAGFSTRRSSGQITTSDMLWFAIQIARGMAFLTENMVLHRDVALRNVLLKTDFTIRVADFGLSRKAGNDGYYVQHNCLAIPIRYIAPEALRFLRFSIKSELWAFGVVLWELFTFAQHPPYSQELGDCDRLKLLEYLDAGNRLKLPNTAPESVRNIITRVWNETSTERPSFANCESGLNRELGLACPSLSAQATRNWDEKSSRQISYRFLSVHSIKRSSRFAPLRLEWMFNTSDIFDQIVNVPKFRGFQSLDTGCVVLTWQMSAKRVPIGPEFDFHQFVIFAQYIDGPPYKVRFWKSSLLLDDQGREISFDNDFDNNGRIYTPRQNGTIVAAAMNSSLNELYTLRVELFLELDNNTNRCETALSNRNSNKASASDIKTLCSAHHLQTERFLYYLNGCYVGSNTMTNLTHARLLCNHILNSTVARLAWLESIDLLEKLHSPLGGSTTAAKLQYQIVPWFVDKTRNTGKTIYPAWQRKEYLPLTNESDSEIMTIRTWVNDRESGDEGNGRSSVLVWNNMGFDIYPSDKYEVAKYLCEYR